MKRNILGTDLACDFSILLSSYWLDCYVIRGKWVKRNVLGTNLAYDFTILVLF